MIEITAEMCVAAIEFLRGVDMVCFYADQIKGDGVTAFQCVMQGGKEVQVLVGGES